MNRRPLGRTGLHIAPLVFGGNVFGWTADEARSFDLLDTFVDAGFNAIDTADSYSRWVPGHVGGESESIIGRWLKARPSRRDQVLLFTKVGSDMGQGHKDLSPGWIEREVDASLKRLQTDVIDLYQAHWHDPATPYDQTLGAFDRVLRAGKVRAIGCSNHDATQLADALATSQRLGVAAYQTLQPEYNLYDRAGFEGPLQALCQRDGLGVITYYSLASGFLTGKYRSAADAGKSARGGRMANRLNARGLRILAALDEVGARHGAQPAEVALAWLMAQPGVTAPIASATSVAQLQSLARAASLQLGDDDIAVLNTASQP